MCARESPVTVFASFDCAILIFSEFSHVISQEFRRKCSMLRICKYNLNMPEVNLKINFNLDLFLFAV